MSKQTLTTMARLLERDGLVERRVDPNDARAQQVFRTPRARLFEPVAAGVLAELDALAGARRRSPRRTACRRPQ